MPKTLTEEMGKQIAREHTKENTMSNFSFLKIENEYTRNEAYQKMTEYALSAESYFYVMDIACAQYVSQCIL